MYTEILNNDIFIFSRRAKGSASMGERIIIEDAALALYINKIYMNHEKKEKNVSGTKKLIVFLPKNHQ